MKSTFTTTAIGLALLTIAATAQAATDSSKAVASHSAPHPTSMCAKGDEVVFSCPLAGGKKVVSMCAASDVTRNAGRFYYAYGRDAAAPELVYPGKDQGAGSFTRTHLGFAGNTGGYAYAFSNGGYKYIVYSISGERDLQDGGVIVQRESDAHAAKKMPCESGKVIDTNKDDLIDATLKWKSDAVIEQHGLPATH
ncbi:hypothetical protein [Dyella subtropica]|uniref:hypothetical protein n=1 Tax=Dyella subtropica TaxID=2992127 RepID=UPI0022580B34|nr:hypothetical protein [Dyella subtropica]